MSWLITPQIKSPEGIPAGTPYGGGYFVSLFTYSGGNPTHALIVAPKASGELSAAQWKTTQTTTAGTTSPTDGAVNTAAMVTAGIADHPAAEFCVGLSIGGFTDWYLPAASELATAYNLLKAASDPNGLFATGGSEVFSSSTYWSSTEANATNALRRNFSNNFAVGSTKTSSFYARAFRRIAL
jgi:hypothetical protein